MSPKTPLKRMYVRANPEARHALKTLLAALQSPSLLPDLSQEEMVTASWLWMTEMKAKDVAKGIAPFVKAIRESLSESDQEGVSKTGDVVRNLKGPALDASLDATDDARTRVAKPKTGKKDRA